jgi:hypothetical protein
MILATATMVAGVCLIVSTKSAVPKRPSPVYIWHGDGELQRRASLQRLAASSGSKYGSREFAISAPAFIKSSNAVEERLER